MKKIILAVIASFMLFCGCAHEEKTAAVNEISSSSSGEEIENTGDVTDEKLLRDRYLDVSALPVLDLDIEAKTECDDRTLEIQTPIDNQLELTVYELYYNEVSGDYDRVMNVIGENESLKIIFKNEKEAFDDGNYMEKYILHEINTLTVDDIEKINEYSKKWLYQLITEYDVEKYAVVELDLTFKHNEKSLSMAPQIGDGRYKRYYALCKTPQYEDYKIYEIYWDDFLG